ncbi:MAG: outer membrane protein assembly factor BamB [Methylococcaceae bacterium]
MRRILLLSACINLVGCAAIDTMNESFDAVGNFFKGGEDNSDPPLKLIDIAPEIKIKVLWKESVGVGADEQSLKLLPAIADNKVFAADKEGLVQARNASTGDLIWKTKTEKNISSGPGIGEGTVVVGTSDAEVVALNGETGKQLWKTNLSSEILAVPVVANNVVVVRSTDGTVVALNEKTGGKLWAYEHNVPALSIRGAGAPLVVGDTLISGDDNGKLMALRLVDGKILWETSVVMPKGRSEIERLVDLDVDPIEAAGTVYIASYRGGIAAVSATDGEVLWRNETISSSSGLSNDWRNLYLSDAQSHVWQIEQRTGAPLWQQKTLHQRKLTAPAVYQSYVVVGDFEGYVHWLSTEDGRELARVQISSSPIDAKPVVIENTVYIYAKDGTLAALVAH